MTRCIVGWAVVPERTTEALQALLDRSPQAQRYYSDDFSTYHSLVYYPARHPARRDKSQTSNTHYPGTTAARICPVIQ